MHFRPRIERDPEVTRLNQKVQEQLWNIVQESVPKEEQQPQEVIKFVSFEDALRELVALKNS
jgi:hypothetical protein